MLDTKLITYLANLSKIEVDDVRWEQLAIEMSAIVELMDTINEVEIEDEINLNGDGVNLEYLREDEKVASFDREWILANAAHKKDGFFVVPKIME